MARPEEERETRIDREVSLFTKEKLTVREIARRVDVAPKTVRADLRTRLGRRYAPSPGARRISPEEIRRRREIAATSSTWDDYEARVHPNSVDRRVNPKNDTMSYGIQIRGPV